MTEHRDIETLAETATASSKEMAIELANRFGVKKLAEIWERHNVDIRAWHSAVKADYKARIEALEAQLAEAERRGAERMRERAASVAMDQERACVEWHQKTRHHANVYEQMPIVAVRIRALPLTEGGE